MTEKACQYCHKVIAPYDPDRDQSGNYHRSCAVRELRRLQLYEAHRMKVLYLMSIALVLLTATGCASNSIKAGDKWVRGCTAERSAATGNLIYEKAIVVSMTPQGGAYWIAYPERSVPEGRSPQAEAMDLDTFKRVFRRLCPPGMWGVAGLSAAE